MPSFARRNGLYGTQIITGPRSVLLRLALGPERVEFPVLVVLRPDARFGDPVPEAVRTAVLAGAAEASARNRPAPTAARVRGGQRRPVHSAAAGSVGHRHPARGAGRGRLRRARRPGISKGTPNQGMHASGCNRLNWSRGSPAAAAGERCRYSINSMTVTADIAAEIERLVDVWRDRLLQVAAETAHSKPSADRWSISEVVGHLVDSACNNHHRFVRAQSTNALVFPNYEQNEWVSAAHYRDGSWKSLAALWCEYNRMLAGLIRNIPAQRLGVPCTITPNDTCTLEFLVTDYLDHLNHHLAILNTRLGPPETA
jgi:DinB superfamily